MKKKHESQFQITGPVVVVIAPLPPPLHGLSASSERIVARLSAEANSIISIRNTASGHQATRRLGKLTSSMLGVADLIRHCRIKNKSSYITVDGGYGVLLNLLVSFIARLLNYNIFLHHHSYAYITAKRISMRLLSWTTGKQSTNIALCRCMAEELTRIYPAMKQQLVLSNAGLLIAPSELKFKSPDSAIQLGFLSNLILEKGLDTSIELLRAGLSRGLALKLMIAGPTVGPKSEALLKSAMSEFPNEIIYTGALDEIGKSNFFSAIDVFCFPSRYVNEAQPRTILEALMHSRPVMSINRGCISEAIGDAGICVSVGGDFIAEAITYLDILIQQPKALIVEQRKARARWKTLEQEGKLQLESLIMQLTNIR